jgi:hypothetical protein
MEQHYTPEQKQTINFTKLVELTNEKPSCKVGEVFVTDIPLSKENIEQSIKILIQGMEIDLITPKIESITNEILEACRNIGDEKKPRIILEIMKKYVSYGYKELIQDNPLAVEVVKSTTCKISELVESGFGICRHLAPLYLYFATQVGLKGVIQDNIATQKDFVNVYRDKVQKTKLFKNSEIGQKIGGHMWANIMVNDKWIMVDPSVNLVGDNEYDIGLIEESGYKFQTYAPELKSDQPKNIRMYGKPASTKVSQTGKPVMVEIFVENEDLKETGGWFGNPVVPAKKSQFKGVIDCYVNSEVDNTGRKIIVTE